MRCQITAAVAHSLYLIEKLTVDSTEGTLGSESDCGAQPGICATIIDLPVMMEIMCAVIAVCIWAVVLYLNRDL